MNYKTLAPILLGAITLIFALGELIGESRGRNEVYSQLASTKPDTVWILDTNKVMISNLEAKIEELNHQYAVNDSDKWKAITFYESVIKSLQDSLSSKSYFVQIDTTADSVYAHIRYTFPPINTWDILLRSYNHSTVITKTIVKEFSMFGPYARASFIGLYGDKFVNLADKRFEIGPGLSWQVNRTLLDFEPFTLIIQDSKVNLQFSVTARYYPVFN